MKVEVVRPLADRIGDYTGTGSLVARIAAYTPPIQSPLVARIAAYTPPAISMAEQVAQIRALPETP